MRTRLAWVLVAAVCSLTICDVAAQDIGPNFHRIADGIYVYLGNARNQVDTAHDSNAGIIITNAGVVLIDTGNNPTGSRAIEAAVKKLTSQPVRYIILTEPHVDHYTGSWIFSPPATVITHAPGIESMKVRAEGDAPRIKKMMADSAEQRAALDGYRYVIPQREYKGDKETLQVGERTIELLYLKNVHSEADTAVWLPKERVVFTAAAIVVDQFNVFRPFVTIPDIQAAIKRLKALNPKYVIPGHGVAGIPATARIFDESEQYYRLLLDRVERMVNEGKSLEQITKELRMPEFDHWGSKDRIPPAIEAAYKTVKGIPQPAFKVGEPCNYQPPPCPSTTR
jgi:glyoxylase-like metal-dependent hydrolase (beta-lactamase superfamily II)